MHVVRKPCHLLGLGVRVRVKVYWSFFRQKWSFFRSVMVDVFFSAKSGLFSAVRWSLFRSGLALGLGLG